LQLAEHYADHDSPALYHAAPGDFPHFSFALPTFDSDAAVPLLYISFGVQSALSNVQQPRSGSGQSHPSAVFGYLQPHLFAKCHPAHSGCFQKYLTVVGYAVAYAQHAWSEILHSAFHSNLSRNVAVCEMCSVVHCHLGLDLFVLPDDDDMLLDSDGEEDVTLAHGSSQTPQESSGVLRSL